MIHIHVLGPVDLTVDGGAPPRELLWRKNLALLVYLARSPERRRARSHLLGLLWGEKPESAARHSLNEALRTLRRHGAEELVDSEGEQVALREGLLRLDGELVEERLAAGDPEAAAALVRGDFMEGFEVPDSSAFEDWLAAERVLWRRRSVEALGGAAEALLTRGELAGARAAAERARALDPLSNAAVRAAMRAAALAGERAVALETYEEFAGHLRRELRVEPEPGTVRLADRIRRERTWKLPEAVREEERAGRRPPLAGRRDALSAALDVWSRVRAGERAALLVLEGEPGVGKTRLAEEVLARARLDGGVLAAIRAVPADREAAWSGLLGLCRDLVEAPGLVAAPPGALAAVAREIPEWEERFGDEIGGARPAPPGRAFGQLLRAAAAEQPLVLLVDDAEWLDRDSALALAGALRDLEGRPFLLALASAAHPPREEFDELRARLGRDLEGAAIVLRPLEAADLRELAAAALPDYDEAALERLTRRLHTDSAGLPLLATEILNAVRLGLELEGLPPAWPEPFRTLDQTLPGELPDAVVAAIRIGYRRLTPGAQRVLAAAAVLRERVEPAELERATGLPAAEVAAALDELEWGRWLAAEPRGYSFVARIVREVVAEDMLTPGQRRRLLEAVGVPDAAGLPDATKLPDAETGAEGGADAG